MRLSPAILAASLALAGAGCATPHRTFSGELKYGKTAEWNLKAGEEEFQHKNYAEAEKFFEYTKNRFPFAAQAITAELRAADAKFEQQRYVEAADSYQHFVKLHPNNEMAEYAEFRAGLCLLQQAPGDFVLFPASYELDLKQVRAASTQLEDFLKSHPNSKYAPDAQKALARANDKLAENDWYAANFYAKRHHWAGAAGRLETLLREYPGSRHETEAMMTLAQTYLKMNERFRAQQTLQQLIVKHPDDSRRAEAEKLLASLR